MKTETTLMFLVLLLCFYHYAVYSFPTRRESTHAQLKRMTKASEMSESNEVFQRNFRTGQNPCITQKECHDFEEGGSTKRVCIELSEITCR